MPRKKKPVTVTQKPTSVKDKSSKKLKRGNASTTNKVGNAAIPGRDVAAEEVCKLLNVFPEEIWLLVFGKLKNTEDVTAIFHSSLYFRNLLLPQRASFLFPQAWKVLGRKYEDKDDDPVYEQGRQNSRLRQYPTSNGELLQFRLHSVALKLRQVCKNWCNGVDQFYQNLDSTLKLKNQGSLSSRWNGVAHVHERFWEKCYSLYTQQDIDNFRNHFDQTHLGKNKRSPFLTNEICIRVIELTEYTVHLKRFLEEYNQHIWHCNLVVNRHRRSLSEVYLETRSVLELLPNLVGLRVWHQGPHGSKLNQKIALKNPLPTLNKLEYLKTDHLPAELYTHLITRNVHIKILEIGQGSTLSKDILTTKIPTLSQLSIDIRSNTEFEKLCDIVWKPEKIKLRFAICGYIPWSKIFKFVETKWGETVTDIKLRLPRCSTKACILQHIQEHDSLRLNLPKVKRLRIELGNYSGIDFILPMKDSLKHLEVSENFCLEPNNYHPINRAWNSAEFPKVLKKRCVVKLPNEESKYNTNIWKIFAKLDTLKFCDIDEVCTREGYLYLQKKQSLK